MSDPGQRLLLDPVIAARRMLRTGRAIEIRRAAGISQGEVGRRIGRSQATVNHWEQRRNGPHAPEAALLGRLLLDLAADLRMEAP